MLTYDFRLPPGPRTVEYALLAEELPNQSASAGFPDLQSTLAQLSAAFAIASGLGFTKLAVQVNPSPPVGSGNTVEFDLTHPFVVGAHAFLACGERRI